MINFEAEIKLNEAKKAKQKLPIMFKIFRAIGNFGYRFLPAVKETTPPEIPWEQKQQLIKDLNQHIQEHFGPEQPPALQGIDIMVIALSEKETSVVCKCVKYLDTNFDFLRKGGTITLHEVILDYEPELTAYCRKYPDHDLKIRLLANAEKTGHGMSKIIRGIRIHNIESEINETDPAFYVLTGSFAEEEPWQPFGRPVDPVAKGV